MRLHKGKIACNPVEMGPEHRTTENRLHAASTLAREGAGSPWLAPLHTATRRTLEEATSRGAGLHTASCSSADRLALITLAHLVAVAPTAHQASRSLAARLSAFTRRARLNTVLVFAALSARRCDIFRTSGFATCGAGTCPRPAGAQVHGAARQRTCEARVRGVVGTGARAERGEQERRTDTLTKGHVSRSLPLLKHGRPKQPRDTHGQAT